MQETHVENSSSHIKSKQKVISANKPLVSSANVRGGLFTDGQTGECLQAAGSINTHCGPRRGQTLFLSVHCFGLRSCRKAPNYPVFRRRALGENHNGAALPAGFVSFPQGQHPGRQVTAAV